MSMRVRTTYLAICDYPGCCLGHEFWELTEEHAIETVIDDDEWLCLFTGDNEPRFFCPCTCDTGQTPRRMTRRQSFSIQTVQQHNQPCTL